MLRCSTTAMQHKIQRCGVSFHFLASANIPVVCWCYKLFSDGLACPDQLDSRLTDKCFPSCGLHQHELPTPMKKKKEKKNMVPAHSQQC